MTDAGDKEPFPFSPRVPEGADGQSPETVNNALREWRAMEERFWQGGTPIGAIHSFDKNGSSVQMGGHLYDALQAVVAAARCGNPLLVKLALSELNRAERLPFPMKG